jgi:CheY-like chemotaxis protein
MPERDGYWLIQEVRKAGASVPAIALTAFSRHDDIDRVRASGFDHHLVKPVDPRRLVDVVASCRTAREM